MVDSWKPKHENSHATKFKLASRFSKFVLFSFLGGLALLFAIIVFFATQVPSPDELSNRNIAQATKIFDRNGELLYNIYQDQNRTPIKLADIPDYVKKATISIEDKDFYTHGGFSITGILRSFFELVKNRSISGGGSTLTQQLVKNALLTGEQSLTRKLKELILSIQVERAYSKDQILEMYLNEIPYGSTAYGVEAASNLYFGKSAKDLTLAEAALIAGLPQRPSVYSPYQHPDLAKERQKEVLRRMVEDKYITQSQADEAVKQELVYRTTQNQQGFKAPHFVLYVKEKLIEQYGDKMVEQGGLRVTTTLDYKIQEQTEKIVKDEIEKLKSSKIGNGAVVVLDPKTGDILAMVGSKDYFGDSSPAGCEEGVSCVFDPNVNVATKPRQPGSATKPITYAKMLEKGYPTSQVLMDVKTSFANGDQKDYTPVNYDGQFRGPVQIRYALGNSLNIPAVKALGITGVKDVMDLGYKMGIKNWEPTQENVASVGLSLTLGGREVTLLDLTSAFGTFANKGKHIESNSILKVTDVKGNNLNPPQRDTEGRKVLDEGIAFIISDILSDNGARTAAFGANSVLNVPGKTAAVKTGTTDRKKDNWAIGYTPSVVVGVWVGNNDNSDLDPKIASGVTGASPIWNKVMSTVLKDKPRESFDRPVNVNQLDIDGLMGGKPKDGSPTRKEYFLSGSEPRDVSPAYQHLKTCKSNPHRLANDGEDADERDVIVLKEDDPTGANKWQEGIDQWVLTAADARLVGATKGCNGIPGFAATSDNPSAVIQIVNVGNGANVPRVFDVLAKANSPAGVKKVTWQVDGAQKATQTAEPYSLHVEFPDGDKGSHTISVTLEDNNGGIFIAPIGVNVAL